MRVFIEATNAKACEPSINFTWLNSNFCCIIIFITRTRVEFQAQACSANAICEETAAAVFANNVTEILLANGTVCLIC